MAIDCKTFSFISQHSYVLIAMNLASLQSAYFLHFIQFEKKYENTHQKLKLDD